MLTSMKRKFTALTATALLLLVALSLLLGVEYFKYDSRHIKSWPHLQPSVEEPPSAGTSKLPSLIPVFLAKIKL